MEYPEGKVRAAVQRIMRFLSQGDYTELANLTRPDLGRLRPEDIERTIKSYPATVREPTDNELRYDVIEVEGRVPREFSVDAPVFTVEEGRSDLTARLLVIDYPGDNFEVVLYDIWVM